MRLFRRKGGHRGLARPAAEGPLSAWRSGEAGVITQIASTAPVCSRLREFGVVPGVAVRVLRSDCPLILQVGQERLCLRKRDAARIRVRARAAAAPGPRPRA